MRWIVRNNEGTKQVTRNWVLKLAGMENNAKQNGSLSCVRELSTSRMLESILASTGPACREDAIFRAGSYLVIRNNYC